MTYRPEYIEYGCRLHYEEIGYWYNTQYDVKSNVEKIPISNITQQVITLYNKETPYLNRQVNVTCETTNPAANLQITAPPGKKA